MKILNAMTIDVEEYFQVSAFRNVVRGEEWGSMGTRVEANTDRILDLLSEARVAATFFVLGWIAERHSGLVKRIADCGHEIASHGYSHRLIHEQQRHEFREETARSRKILQDATGQPVSGYRAASFSIGRRNLWALDDLVESGFVYDSSIFPVIHDRYGMPGATRRIHRLTTPNGGTLIEVPPSCIAWHGWTLPVCGGGYLRLYPAAFTRWSIRRLNLAEALPAIIYVHPWEVDPEQPRVRASLLSRFRHYSGLRTTETKLRDLMSRFLFGPMWQVIQQDPDVGGEAAEHAMATGRSR